MSWWLKDTIILVFSFSRFFSSSFWFICSFTISCHYRLVYSRFIVRENSIFQKSILAFERYQLTQLFLSLTRHIHMIKFIFRPFPNLCKKKYSQSLNCHEKETPQMWFPLNHKFQSKLWMTKVGAQKTFNRFCWQQVMKKTSQKRFHEFDWSFLEKNSKF